jgi:hypothetical protein
VLGLLSVANPAWAAPKKKSKAKHAASAEPQVAPPDKESPKNTDDLMDDSSKRKPAASKPDTTSQSADKPDESAAVGEPDAWERPPAEEEKPRPKRFEVPEEKKGDGRRFEIGLLAGWGATVSTAPYSQDPYGLGFGLRASYTFDFRLTVGLGYEYYLGSNGAVYNSRSTTYENSKVNSQWIHAEAGYDFWFGKFLLRPSIWIAVAITVKNPALQAGTSGVLLATVVAPGLGLNYMLGDNGWYLGADARLSLIIGTGSTTLPLLATFGKRF